MPPRKRNSGNQPLPRGWRHRYNAYYYMVPRGQEHAWDGKREFRLGESLPEAYQVWAERLGDLDVRVRTFADLVTRYRLEELPSKAATTQQQYDLGLRRLLPVFGRTAPASIEPHHANRYFDLLKRKKSVASARADIGVLRAVLSFGTKVGVMKANPLKGQLHLETVDGGLRYIEDWEVEEMLTMPLAANASGMRMLQLYLRLKLLTGLRRGDLLRLRVSQLKADGIHVEPHKTKGSSRKRMIFLWLPEDAEPGDRSELRDVVDALLALPPRRIGDALLITTARGDGFLNEETGRANGFDSLCQRFVKAVLERTRVSEHFTEKDVRAKVGSDAVSDEAAATQLGHSSTKVTKKNYRRRPSVIPLRKTTRD